MITKRILLIEDDPKSLYALRSVLTDRGYDVTACASAEEANDVSCDHLHVAIVDVRLPQIQGTDFAITLRAKCPDLKIIFITAYNNIAEIAQTITNSHILVKPLNMTKLYSML